MTSARCLLTMLLASLMMLMNVTSVFAEDDRVSSWFGFERRDFKVDGRACLMIVPQQIGEGRPWIWRTEFFGHEPQADLALAARGFHVVYIDVQNMYGAPIALDHMDRFYEHLTTTRGLAKKTVLEGFSRGGLFSLNWAARHPDRVACIYNDAPVCDFKSWPGGKGKGPGSAGDWQRCLQAYGLTEAEALAYKLNPVDNLASMAKAKIPLLHVCGEADEVVPFDENTQLIEDRYRELGGPITVIAKPGVKHHPHSLKNAQPIVRFVLAHTTREVDADVLVEFPSDYQIIQRDNKGVGTIPLSGWLGVRQCQLEYQIVKAGQPATADTPATEGIVVQDWAPLDVARRLQRFDAKVSVPAGGWYQVLFRVTCQGRPTVHAAVRHVGIGEVFVIAGQSNSTNSGAERLKTQTQRVSTFDGMNWRLADDPQPGVADGSTGGSFLPAFGDALAQKLGVPIGVASTGAGATSVRQWLPRGTRMKNLPTIASRVKQVGPGEWEATGELFDGLMRRVESLGPDGCRAILWHQGESDAGQAREGYPADRQITGQQYHDFMATLIAASQKQAGRKLPWITAQATYHSEKDAADEEFRAAQKSLWTEGLAIEGPDTDSLRAEYRAGVHFNAKGQQAHGELWAEKVAAWLAKP